MDKLKGEYLSTNAWGLATSIDLHSCNPKLIRDKESIKKYVIELCDLIQVKRFEECTVVHFGNREEIAGFSMVQLIESSLISGHFANKTNNVYLDIFSCHFYDYQKVVKFSENFFKSKDCIVNIHLRK